MSLYNGPKIKLVFLIGQLGLGGSERQLFLLLSHLDPNQFERHVIVFNPSPNVVYDEALRQNGVEVIHIPANCQGVRARLQFITCKLRQINADIVHSWTVHDNPYAGIGGRLARVPHFWGSLRGSLYAPGFQGLPFPYRYLSLHSVSQIVVNSSALVKQLADGRYPAKRVVNLPNCVAVQPPNYVPDLAEYGIQPDHRVIGIVGNLRTVKNHKMFIEGMAKVLPQLPDVRAIIVGQPLPNEPDLEQQLNQHIDRLGLTERLILTGFRPDVPELMFRLDLFCLTSRSEGVPNALMEAMAAGCPVVATRVGGIPDLVDDGINGMLVDSEDVAGFAQKVTHLLNNKEYASQLGEAGRKVVALNYGCEKIAAQLGQMYIQAKVAT